MNSRISLSFLLTVLAALSMMASGLVPENYRVALVAPNGKCESVEAAMKANGWKCSTYEAGTNGWNKLASSLKGVDIVLSIKSTAMMPEHAKAAYSSFIANGGAFVALGISSQDDLDAISGIYATNSIPRWRKDTEEVKCGRLQPHGRLLTYPNYSKEPQVDPCGGMELPGDVSRRWETAAHRNKGNIPCVIIQRSWHGMAVLSSAGFTQPAFFGNIAKALELQRLNLRFNGISSDSWDGKGRSELPQFGHGCCDVQLRGTGTTNASVKTMIRFSKGDEERVWRGHSSRRQNEDFSSRMNGLFDMNGKWHVEIEATDDWTGKTIKLLEKEVEYPDYLTIEMPFYRKSISTARRESNVKLALVVSSYAEDMRGRKATVTLFSTDGKTPLAQKDLVFSDGRRLEFTLPLAADAPEGKYSVEATIDMADGITKATARDSFDIVPVRPNQVFIDQDGVLLADGKPWFPIGLYHVPPDEIEAAAATGIDVMQFWDSYCTPGPTGTMARAKAAGVKLLIEDGIWGAVVNTFINPPEKYMFETSERFRMREEMERDSGNVAFWYTADEPGRECLPGIKKANAHRHAVDPDHPTYIVSTGDPGMGEGADILALDVYVRYHKSNQALTGVSDAIDKAYRATNRRQCIMMVPQAFGNYEMHHETPEEVRAMTYLAVTHGVRGIIWYCWRDGGEQGMVFHEKPRESLTKVISELKVFRNALLRPGARQTRSLDGRIHSILCGDETTGRFLIYVNGTDDPSDSELIYPELDGAKLTPLFDTPAAKNKHGKIALKLPMQATGVFKVE